MSEQVHRKEDSVGSGSVAAGNQGQQEPAKMQSVNLSYQQQQPHPYNPAQQFVYVPGQSVPIIPSSNGGFIQQIRPQDNPNVFAQFIPVNYLQGQANQQYNASQPGNFPMKFMPGFQFYQHPMQVMPQQIVCVPNMNQPPHVQVSSKDSPRKSPNIQDNLEAKAPAHSELKSEQISDSTEDTEDEEEAEYEEDKNEMKRNLASENNFSEFKKPHSPQRSFGSMAAAEAEAVDAMLNSSNIQVSDDRDPHSDNDQKVTGKSLDTKKHYENSGKKRKMDNNTNENIEEREVYSVSKSVGSVKSITEEDESGRSADEYIYTQIYGEPLKTECIKCQNEFLYPRGHEKVRCPHCSEVVEVPSPQETEESKKIEQKYFDDLEEFAEHFLNNASALVWLARTMPTRSFKLPVPKSCRWPRANSGYGGYATAFKKLGLVLRDADTKSGHWHYWYIDPSIVKFRELQRALMARWRASPHFSIEDADRCQKKIKHEIDRNPASLVNEVKQGAGVEFLQNPVMYTSLSQQLQNFQQTSNSFVVYPVSQNQVNYPVMLPQNSSALSNTPVIAVNGMQAAANLHLRPAGFVNQAPDLSKTSVGLQYPGVSGSPIVILKPNGDGSNIASNFLGSFMGMPNQFIQLGQQPFIYQVPPQFPQQQNSGLTSMPPPQIPVTPEKKSPSKQ